LYWAAPPDLRPRPAPRGPQQPPSHTLPFTNHIAALHAAYGKHVLLLDLLVGGAHRGAGLRLHDTLAQQAAMMNARLKEQAAAGGGGGGGGATSATSAAAAAAGGG
ncbi:hypothetical protein Agub_g13466, partial [Astrephomene gubernaculifera]